MDEGLHRKGSPAVCAALLAVVSVALPGCALFERPDWAIAGEEVPARPQPAELPPLDSSRFVLGEDSVVGEIQVVRARHEDTFVDLARAYGLGYDELVAANPDVDPWLPGEGTLVVLPTRFVLPDAPRRGIVLNIGAKRIFHFPEPAAGEPAEVVTYPVGIGREGWATPTGSTKIISKHKDPTWVVPASIRRERAAAGDPLPARVPPGPDNPLGHRSLRLSLPSYLIHGTNKPAGIGMRVSHGCIQLFPEDIESLFEQVAVGTPVLIVNQPRVFGWQGDTLYVDAHPLLEDDDRPHERLLAEALERALKHRPDAQLEPDRALLERSLAEARGLPVPLLNPAADAASVVARARRVVNVLARPDEPSPEQPEVAARND